MRVMTKGCDTLQVPGRLFALGNSYMAYTRQIKVINGLVPIYPCGALRLKCIFNLAEGTASLSNIYSQ